MSKPLERDLARIAAKRARAAQQVAEFDRQLAVLQRAQQELIEAVAEETRLHDSHSDVTISDMQAQSSHSLGVRIAEGRAGQSKSRKAQIAANLTDKEVAELTGVHRTTVCKWHNGSMKVPEAARKLLAKRGIPETSWTKR